MRPQIGSLESKEARRVEILKEARKITDWIFSLKGKCQVFPSSRRDELQSSGDLIHFSASPAVGFGSQTLAAGSCFKQSIQVQGKQIHHDDDLRLREQSSSGSVASIDTIMNSPWYSLCYMAEGEESSEFVNSGGKVLSEACYLRKVLREELDSYVVSSHELIMVAVHAAFLGAGFLGFNPICCTPVDGFYFLKQLPPNDRSLSYSLPQLFPYKFSDKPEFVTVKFQSLGHLINIYGHLKTKIGGGYRLCLNKIVVAAALNLLRDETSNKDEKEKQVMEFWISVKDGLAFPLLIHLCDEFGLAPPPCFMLLPKDLKHNILQRLPGVDIARMGCVCKEMNRLSSNNDLWKRKVFEKFGPMELDEWKTEYASHWVDLKREEDNQSWALLMKQCGILPLSSTNLSDEECFFSDADTPVDFPYFPPNLIPWETSPSFSPY